MHAQQDSADTVALYIIIGIIGLGREKHLHARISPYPTVVLTIAGSYAVLFHSEVHQQFIVSISQPKLHLRLVGKTLCPATTTDSIPLHDKMTLDRMWVLRNHIAEMTAMEAMTFVKERLERCKNNEEFLLAMNS